MKPNQIMDKIFQSRGIESPDEWLYPDGFNILPPQYLANIQSAGQLCMSTIKLSKNIIVHADVDVDGITAGTIVTRYLRHLTDKVSCIINEGKQHGLHGTDLSRFNNADLIIVCDSLDNTNESYSQLVSEGKEIIILDHHDINPNIDYHMVHLVSSQNNYANPDLSGAGVCFKFCQMLDEINHSCFADEYWDLATVGIIGDMCSMTSLENRAICHCGLSQPTNPFLRQITKGFGFSSKSVSFSIAPLINSANRTGNNELALQTFLADDEKELKWNIKALKKCKKIQNTEVDSFLPTTISQCETQNNNPVMCVKIHTEYNLSGLIGNKLMGIYKKPIIVLRQIIDGTYYGSGRGINVDNFRQLCVDTGLCKANGHASAFGIEIKEHDLKQFLQEINFKLANCKFEQTNTVDILLNPEDISFDLINQIKEFDRITGTNCPAVSVLLAVDNYDISTMSNGKHLVIKPNNQLDIIQWNYEGNINDMEEHSMLGDEIIAVGNLDSGYLGKRFSLKLIASSIEVTS